MKRKDLSGGRFGKEVPNLEVYSARPPGSTSIRPLLPHEMLLIGQKNGTSETTSVIASTFKNQPCCRTDRQEVQAASENTSISSTATSQYHMSRTSLRADSLKRSFATLEMILRSINPIHHACGCVQTPKQDLASTNWLRSSVDHYSLGAMQDSTIVFSSREKTSAIADCTR